MRNIMENFDFNTLDKYIKFSKKQCDSIFNEKELRVSTYVISGTENACKRL